MSEEGSEEREGAGWDLSTCAHHRLIYLSFAFLLPPTCVASFRVLPVFVFRLSFFVVVYIFYSFPPISSSLFQFFF